MTHRGAGIHPERVSVQRERLLWGVALSLLLHLFLLLSAATWLPSLARRLGSSTLESKPDVLTFRFHERAADVDESSRTPTKPQTPLIGRFDSQARDRVRDARDTPFPAGGVHSTENALPGSEGEEKPAGRPSAARPGADGSRAEPDPAGMVIADAIGSETSLLTGKSTPIRRTGHGAQTDVAEGEDGALQFGDYSFSTRAWDYEPYWFYMRERLYANWHPPAAYKDYGIIQGGWTMVRAVLDRQGRLVHAKIIGQNGHASLHPASFAAMVGAAPFRPLPASFPDDSLVVTVRFIYLPPGEPAPARDRR